MDELIKSESGLGLAPTKVEQGNLAIMQIGRVVFTHSLMMKQNFALENAISTL